MKRFFPTACLPKAAFGIVLSAASLHAAAGTNKTEVVDVARLLNAARESAVQVPSLFMSQQEKIETVEVFVKIIETVSDSNEWDWAWAMMCASPPGRTRFFISAPLTKATTKKRG